MPARGKHRRPRNSTLTRGIVAAGTGGAALALPLVGATGAQAATPNAVPQVSLVTYKVVEGDTLSKIAKAHTTGDWKKLYKANRAVIGDDPSTIRPGLKLTVGTKNGGTSAKTATASKASTASAVTPASAKTYTDDLDGWIRESLDVMAQQGIPGTYDGIHRNIIRESSGNPQAMNNWDSNAVAGTPSKGLLQVIDPTFSAYHVTGTSLDPFDPVANITAACNYAAARYGSIDNVFGAY
ncbi:transglycosylase SLT domain-containing protein [Streptomyces sp. NPDC057621]|uniref:LysM peptidoglycan-binding domain-containing protein n=1 Tax=Streptomyces liliiviolaceus TaxID=2823109 RepID=A0A940XT39_9ACTN|nr:LysM peptidoglycan-binding domain-containing protein [Streptomyces liliiviolaceus]MBQ0848433.1 LysM peptidoglycan-binding domain-containing protein [Streptomyces liliiviolaceus]